MKILEMMKKIKIRLPSVSRTRDLWISKDFQLQSIALPTELSGVVLDLSGLYRNLCIMGFTALVSRCSAMPRHRHLSGKAI